MPSWPSCRLEKLFDVKDGAAKVVMPADPRIGVNAVFANHFDPFLHRANVAAATEDLGRAIHNAGVLNAKSSKRQSTKFESRLAPVPCHNVSMTAADSCILYCLYVYMKTHEDN